MNDRRSLKASRNSHPLAPMSGDGELSGSDVFVRHPEVESNPLPDQTVLLFQKDTSLAVPVNAEGAAIWKMCDGAHTVDQIVDRLAEIYDQERSRIDQDVRAFLGELVRLGLVRRLPTPS